MTDGAPLTDGAPPTPAPAHRAERLGLGPWAVALMVGVIVAVLGVNAAIGSVQRKQYFETRDTALYLLKNGNDIGGSTQRLQEVNVRDYNLVKDSQAALDAGDTPLVNRLLAQADVFSSEQDLLEREVQLYKTAFDKALKQ